MGQTVDNLIGVYQSIDDNTNKSFASYVTVTLTDSEGRILSLVRLKHETFQSKILEPIKESIKSDLKDIRAMNIRENKRISEFVNE